MLRDGRVTSNIRRQLRKPRSLRGPRRWRPGGRGSRSRPLSMMSRAGWGITGCQVDDSGPPAAARRRRSCAERSAPAPASSGPAPARQGDVDGGRPAGPHLGRRGRRLERLLDHRDVVGARRQVEDAVAAVHGVDGVGDAVHGVVRLHAEGAHLAAVGGHAPRDDAAVGVLRECGPTGEAGADEQNRRRRDCREGRPPDAAGSWLLRHRLTSVGHRRAPPPGVSPPRLSSRAPRATPTVVY